MPADHVAEPGGVSTPSSLVRPVDDVWLELDRPDNLMVVESVMVLDAPLDRDTYLELVEERLFADFPRLRQRPAWTWRPWPALRWIDDTDFDLDRHVHAVTLSAPGDDAALQSYVSATMSRALDLAHPPWEVHVIAGYRGGTVLYSRLHHALADGTALMRVSLALSDDSAPTGSEPEDTTPWRAPTVPVPTRLLPAAAGVAVGAVTGTAAAARVMGHLLSARRPTSPLSAGLHHAKQAVWAEPVPLADLADLRRSTGTTVTDVAMAALAGTLRRWLVSQGVDPVPDVPTMVPVDLRGAAALEPGELGNQFALVLLDLPTATGTAFGRLAETTARMRRIKDSPEAPVTYGTLQLMGLVHPRARVLLTDFFAHKATGVTTSVHGPDRPLHLAGRRVSRMWAWAPMSGDQSISSSIIGYDGQLHVGFKVDAATVPEPQALADGFAAEVEALRALASRAVPS